MELKQLLAGVEVLDLHANENMQITGVAYDSRKVQPGDLFVAVSGFAADGNRFIPMAMEKGAVAVVSAKKPAVDVPCVQVKSDRLALAQIGANFYGNPAESMQIIGVTGTNGKTSTTLLLKHVLETVQGAKVGLIGTMENLIGEEVIPAERTTPESLDLQALFARMRSAGCTHVIMEVSSHAIALDRVGGLKYQVAAFTNLTEDHLDFHKTMAEYAATKAKLFGRCEKAVINCDDSWADFMLSKAACPVLTTSQKTAADLYATDACLLSDGVSFTAVCGDKKAQVSLPIPGKFTVYNALSVLGIALQYIDIDRWISDNTALMILLATLIGIIPESGPHLIFVTLFAAGVVPFPVLLASSISQDGHASIPLLAESKKSFLMAKLINCIVALAAGFTAMLFF